MTAWSASLRCIVVCVTAGVLGACAPELEWAPEPRERAPTPLAVDPCAGDLDLARADDEPPRIRHIQGIGHVSPWVGRTVRDVPGIVTRVERDGFFLQDPEPDDSDCSSEAIFVFTSSDGSVRAGDRVQVSGQIHEYREGCRACAPSEPGYALLSRTEIAGSVSVEIVARDEALPDPVVLGRGGRLVPHAVMEDDAAGDVELAGVRFDPEQDALDFFESLEGMRIELEDAAVVGPSRGGAASVIPEWPDDALRSSRGALVASMRVRNASRLALVSEVRVELDVGDSFMAPLRGILDTRGERPRLLADSLPAVRPGGLARERSSLGAPGSGELVVATLNVHNLSARSPAAAFATLASLVVDQLKAPDLLALQEIQDDSGTLDDGTTASTATLAALVGAIERAGGPSYAWSAIDPRDGEDGGAPGGNIRVVVMFRTDRGISFTQRGHATATTANRVAAGELGEPRLTYNPGRLAPTHAAFVQSRKPLAVELEFAGAPLFVIANHWSSKLGDAPEFGRFQPPPRATEAQRVAQAEIVAGFVGELLERDPSARVLVLGDLNDHLDSDSVAALEAVGLEAALGRLPPQERYTYVFEGNAQAIDHVLTSLALSARVTDVDVVHAHAEFSSAVTDHDPVLVRFDLR